MNWTVILAAVAVTAVLAFWLSGRFRAAMKDSETILIAWLTGAGGLALGVIQAVDPTLLRQVVPDGWQPWVMLGYGVVLYFARQYRSTDT